jgi:hypothetical protein
VPIVSPPPFGSLTTCVLNANQTDASGGVTLNTGDTAFNLNLSSRVYEGNPKAKRLASTAGRTVAREASIHVCMGRMRARVRVSSRAKHATMLTVRAFT